jgi:hypothetical protein
MQEDLHMVVRVPDQKRREGDALISLLAELAFQLTK